MTAVTMQNDFGRRAWLAAATLVGVMALLLSPAFAQPAPQAAAAPLAKLELGAGEGLPKPWLLGVGLQADEHSTHGYFGTFAYGATERTWLSFSAGRSRSPADRAAVCASTLRAEIDQRLGDFGFTAAVQRFGDADALETDDVAVGGYFTRGDLRLELTLERRDIAIPFTIVGPLGRAVEREAELDANGVALELRFGLGASWSFAARAAEHDYERNLAIVPRIERLDLLSTSALTLAYGFVATQRSLSAERELGRTLLTLAAVRDRSAVDGESYRAYEAALLFPAAGRLDVELNVGHGRSDASDAGWYAGVLVLVYGGR
jgi:hypothetical protein